MELKNVLQKLRNTHSLAKQRIHISNAIHGVSKIESSAIVGDAITT